MLLSRFRVFDAHLHIIDGRYPLVVNQGYLPETFSCEEYLVRMRQYDLAGGAIVSGSFQGFDQDYLLAALQRLGPTFVGVTQLPHTVADETLPKLDAAGVRGVRFNLRRGGSESIKHLDRFARRIYEMMGWHVELYVDSTALDALHDDLISLPAVSVDHLGLSKAGLDSLLKLVEQGVRVKASGFGRVDFDVAEALQNLYTANPQALMYGTDLPSTRAPRSYSDEDFMLVANALGEAAAQQVFYANAAAFYRLEPQPG